MTRIAAALAALVVLSRVTLAAASPCTSDDDSDSDSSSSDSSDSSTEPTCAEQSEVVGRSVCSRFGGWDSAALPRLQFSAGASLHRFALRGVTFSGTAKHEMDVPYRLVVGDNGPDRATAATLDLRAVALVSPFVYAGVEADLGGAEVPAARLVTVEGLAADPARAFHLLGAGVAGFQLPLGDLALRTEAAAGIRILGLSVETEHLACVAQSTAYHHELLFQSRMAIDAWLSPWWTLSAYAGINPFRADDVSVGLSLVGHLRAFDALR